MVCISVFALIAHVMWLLCITVCYLVQVSGPVFLCRSVSERLLQTHVTSPLDGCTYLGMDSGAPSLQVDPCLHCAEQTNQSLLVTTSNIFPIFCTH